MMRHFVCAGTTLAISSSVFAGIYAPAAGQSGSMAIAYDDPIFVEWANAATLNRGPQDINAPSGVLASFGTSADATGQAGSLTTAVVSLGDGGSATLTFPQRITNGAGPDFAVFENGFLDTFLELAFVEVSSDGSNFFRFPSVSLTQNTTQLTNAGAIDATDIDNLAGKYRVGFGTPFDLQQLVGLPGLNVNDIQAVRIVDVVGRIDVAPGNATWLPSRDSLNNIINDPYSTAFASGGFDLDGVGVINVVPEPTMLSCIAAMIVPMMRRRRA